MGACYCRNQFDEHTRYINERLSEEAKAIEMGKINQILLLGPTDSGKSTFCRQLMKLHGNFNIEGAYMVQSDIYCQITYQMKQALKHYINGYSNLPYNTSDTKMKEAMNHVNNIPDVSILSKQTAEAIKYIWQNEPKINSRFKTLETSHHKILHETTEYFWNNIGRIAEDNYIPTETDFVNVRYDSWGGWGASYKVNGIKLNILDVGGTISERRHWMKCFNGIHTVIFMVDLSCYNQMMYHDWTKNRMVDSLELFEKTVNDKHLDNTDFILVFSHIDLFKEKIAKIPISACPAFDVDGMKEFAEKFARYRSVANIFFDGFIRQFLREMDKRYHNVPTDIKFFIGKFAKMEIEAICDYFSCANINIDTEMAMHHDDIVWNPRDYEFVRYYVKHRFQILNKNKMKHIPTYFVNFLDTENTSEFWNKIKSTLSQHRKPSIFKKKQSLLNCLSL